MRYRMLVVAIGLMVLVIATSAAFAQQGDAENDGDTAVGPDKDQIIRELQVEAATAGKLASDTQEKLDAADAKNGVAIKQMGEMRGQLTKTEEELTKLKGRKAQKQQQLNTRTRTAIRTGRKADWHRVGVTAHELKALEAKVSALESEFRNTQQYLHSETGRFTELQGAGFLTKGQADQLYAAKPPATPGKTMTAPAQTPAEGNKKMNPWAIVAIVGLIVAAIVALVVFTPRRVGLAELMILSRRVGPRGQFIIERTPNGMAAAADDEPDFDRRGRRGRRGRDGRDGRDERPDDAPAAGS